MLRGKVRATVQQCVPGLDWCIPSSIVPCKDKIVFTQYNQVQASRTFHSTCKRQDVQSKAGFNDYEKERKNFKLNVPSDYNYATHVVDVWASKEKSGEFKRAQPAFWWVGTSGKEVKWSFSQISEYSKRVASVLNSGCGLQPGDRIMVLLPKIPEWWLIALSAWRAGIVLVPSTLTHQLTPDAIKERLQRSKAKCIISDQDTTEKIDSIIQECPDVKTKVVVAENEDPRTGWHNFKTMYNQADLYEKDRLAKSSDPMSIFFTSGTTGVPKMTLHTHASYGAAQMITGKYWMDQSPDDLYWALPTGSALASWFVAPWIQGAGIFAHEMPAFSPYETLRILNSYPITSFCAPPMAYQLMTQINLTKYHWKRCRNFLSAGQRLNLEVIDSWKNNTKQYIRDGYGQTETILQCGMFRCLDYRPGSMGKPAPGIDLQVIDENCNPVADGEYGDFAIKTSPHRPEGLFQEYIDDPLHMGQAFNDNYYLTGDTGYRDEEGYFWYKGRHDDVMVIAGNRIGAFGIEKALMEHPLVHESAVVGTPDDVDGEAIKAFVVLAEFGKTSFVDKPSLVKELQEHVKTTTAPYKCPKHIIFVDSLPKTASGKMRRVELREREWANHKSIAH